MTGDKRQEDLSYLGSNQQNIAADEESKIVSRLMGGGVGNKVWYTSTCMF